MKTHRIHWNTIGVLVSGFMIVMIAVMIALAVPVHAGQDEILTFKIDEQSMPIQALDKNGNAYVRFIIPKQATLKGHTYTYGVPAMAFGALADQATNFEIGDELVVVATPRNFQGRESYTIRKFIQD